MSSYHCLSVRRRRAAGSTRSLAAGFLDCLTDVCAREKSRRRDFLKESDLDGAVPGDGSTPIGLGGALAA